MAEYTNQGVLFSQDVKKSEKAPDYTGEIILTLRDFTVETDGTIKVRLAGWKRKTKTGKTFLSLRGEQNKPQQQQSRPAQSSSFDDDDVPF